jgi:hypothetical protein
MPAKAIGCVSGYWIARSSRAMTIENVRSSLSRDGLRRFGHGAIAHDAVEGVAVRIEPRLGKFVAQIDEMMVGKRERLIVQYGPDRLDDLKRLLLAARTRPDMQREIMLGAVLGARAPVGSSRGSRFGPG